jgi:DNA ligase-1
MRFETLARTFERLEGTTKRLELMEILAELFKEVSEEEIQEVIYLLQGGVAPPFRGIEIGMGEKFVEEAIARASGKKRKEVEEDYKSTGDLGTTAEKFVRKVSPKKLDISKVYDSFLKISLASGKGTQEVKIGLLTELLSEASPLEAKYLARIPVGKLRLGTGDATIIDALSVRMVGDKSMRDELERAYNMCCDLGEVARVLYQNPEKIKDFRIKVGNPVKPALAERLTSAEEVLEKIGPCYVEAKYDGFRCQLHKSGSSIEIFSRRIERMTHMFPEIVGAAKKQIKGDAIIEGEALCYNDATGEFLPFQETIKRKRKHGIEEMAAELPLKLFVFDVLYDGEDLTDLPYRERRERLEKIVKDGDVIQLSDKIYADSPEKFNQYFNQCIESGLEGVVAKDIRAPYVAGARKFAWIKLKRSYKGELQDTVDLAIVGYYKGRGARAEFGIGALLGAVYDPEEGIFKTVAKVGSGMTEDTMRNLKKVLDEISTKKPVRLDSILEPDVWCEPKYVVEVAADEITRSPSHTCGREKNLGYALRFPRMIGWIREDKRAEDATTVREILDMYKAQRS